MNPLTHEAVQDRHLELLLDELGGRRSPVDCTERVVAALSAGVPRRTAPRRLVGPLVALAAASVVVAVALWKHQPTPRDPAPSGATTGTPATAQQPTAQAPSPAPTTPREHPKGTDPADLAAARGAEAMLAAERRVVAMAAEGRLPAQLVPFASLSNWDYTDGLAGMPESVRSLADTDVTLVGFMLPIDEVENITQFLLVASLWSCCYGTPPDLNQIVRCVMPAGETVDYTFEPLLLSGTLTVAPTIEDGYVVDIFQLHVTTFTPLLPH
ncbi:MAG: DUF3299 domain-containing protein [Planctomycetota bacterium]